jgi:hypothetical protein
VQDIRCSTRRQTSPQMSGPSEREVIAAGAHMPSLCSTCRVGDEARRSNMNAPPAPEHYLNVSKHNREFPHLQGEQNDR